MIISIMEFTDEKWWLTGSSATKNSAVFLGIWRIKKWWLPSGNSTVCYGQCSTDSTDSTLGFWYHSSQSFSCEGSTLVAITIITTIWGMVLTGSYNPRQNFGAGLWRLKPDCIDISPSAWSETGETNSGLCSFSSGVNHLKYWDDGAKICVQGLQ